MASPAPQPGYPSMSAERLVWVDVAKAIAIMLVAIHHSVVFGSAAGWVPEAVASLNNLAQAVRMPLFFLAAGLFAADALRRSWNVVLRRRVLFFAWLYLLWVVIRFVVFQVVPDLRGAGVDGDLHALLISPLLPPARVCGSSTPWACSRCLQRPHCPSRCGCS